ncbi:MAG: hypothetical protein K6F68_00850 [Clostridiales bacterium]|nr:hypothetical protein [Clostridiales bacterium]
MKKLRKLSALLIAVMLVFAFAAIANAQGEAPKETEIPVEPAEVPTTGAEPDATENPIPEGYQIGLFVLDGEGKTVPASAGLLSCMTGGSVDLFIKHDYQIVAKLYNSKNEYLEPDTELILGVDDLSGHTTLEHNRVILHASDTPYTFSLRILSTTAENGETSYPISVKRFKIEATDLLIAALAIYLVVSVFRKNSSLFSNEFIKEEKKPLYNKLITALGVAAGIVLIAGAVIGICFSYLDWAKIVRYVLMGLGAVLIIGMFVVNNVMTDKEKRDKAAQTARTGGGNASKAAFEFDGTEPTLDEVLENMKNEQKNGEN